MLPRRYFVCPLLCACLGLPFACAPTRHEFLPDPGSSGEAGTGNGGTANAGRGATGGSGHSGAAGAGVDEGGQAGESSAGGDAGSGEAGAGGTGPTAGAGPTAGMAGVKNAGGAGGSAATAGSGGAFAGSGGAFAGSGGALAGSGGALAGSGGGFSVAPTILDTAPADDATGVLSDQSITVVFSQPMNTTLTQAAFDKQSLPAGTFSWSADLKTMTYKPSAPLEYATSTAPAVPQAKLYSFQIKTSAESAAGVPLEMAQTFGFTTARRIALELYPTERWSLKSTGSATQCSGACSSLPVGDDAAKVGLRGVFRYSAALPAAAVVQDVQMFIDIAFSEGNVTPLGALQLAKTPSLSSTPTPTGASFSFPVGPNGTNTTVNVLAPGLIANGSFGTSDLFVAVQWSVTSDNDSAADQISVSDGHLLTRYLIP